MDSLRSWKLIGIMLVCIVYCLNNNLASAVAIDSLNESESDTHDSFNPSEIWSPLLEELTINSNVTRQARALQSSYKYIPTSNNYLNRRVDNLMPLGPAALKQNFNFNGPSNSGSRPNNFFNNRISQNGPEVSETDLYLLSAIEKLVYRVDYMERRLRKTEQLVYYLMAGNNEHKKETYEKPCAMNFTRIGDNCYLFVVNQPANWKAANSVCRSYGAHLAELDGSNENNDMAAYLLNHQQLLNGHGNFWLGALNPGLLWIWSSSARPVNPNVNVTQIHKINQADTVMPKVTTKINDDSRKGLKKGSNTNSTVIPIEKKIENTKITNKPPTNEKDMKIEGNGRCLGLSYRADKHIYQLYGLDCNGQQRFVCELPQDHIDNEIDRIAKKLFH